MNETEGSVGSCMGAEESCSVTADPFSSPVSLVFVVSDVSTKACPAVRNNKPRPPLFPTTGLKLRPPCSTGISATFHPRPCPRLPLRSAALNFAEQHSLRSYGRQEEKQLPLFHLEQVVCVDDS
ncbi:hypothetical protein NQZ68_027500 [Dissostichus eleginoides]|nr:hypothetical protein NQZ68_027500 [Dissostichus eleginoides]